MPLLQDPVVTLEDVRLRALSLSSLDLDVMIRVGNPNPIGVTLRGLPFNVLCSSGAGDREIATGNTGRVTIAARGSTLLAIPVTSQNAALAGALAAFLTKGGVQVTIQGTAVIDAVLFSWSIPFSKTVPVTMEQIAGSLGGPAK
jgi:LEA14-like dessication related protein